MHNSFVTKEYHLLVDVGIIHGVEVGKFINAYEHYQCGESTSQTNLHKSKGFPENGVFLISFLSLASLRIDGEKHAQTFHILNVF